MPLYGLSSTSCAPRSRILIEINVRTKATEVLLRAMVRRLAPESLEVRGVSTMVAAALIGHGGNLHNFRKMQTHSRY